MTHLEFDNLASDFVEGLLGPTQLEAAEQHLNDCAGCREILSDLRLAMDLCRTTELAEPSPWLISKIMRATVGERKLTWPERIANYLRPLLQPTVMYPVAMTVFTFSIIVNAAGLNLRDVRLANLNPNTWFERANRQGHMMVAHAEKFYYDLSVVYEVESRFRQLADQQQMQPQETPKPEAPAGGSSQNKPVDPSVASNAGPWPMAADGMEETMALAGSEQDLNRVGRSLIR